MAIQVQLRRGTTTDHSTFTGAVGEVTVDTTKDTLVVHDGSQAGGYPIARAGSTQTWTAEQTFNSGTLKLAGSSSGASTLNAAAVAGSTTISLPDQTSTLGYINTPINSQSAAYTLVLADAAKTILHPTADDNPRTFTIPAESSVDYPIGTVVTFVNLKNTVTIAITTDTMYLAGPGTTGSRTLAEFGVASAVKVASATWIISGNGLT